MTQDAELGNDGLTDEERAYFLLSFQRGKGYRPTHPHAHGVYVEGCFRCDLTSDEMGVDRDPR